MSDSPNTPHRPLTRARRERLAALVDTVLDEPPERRLTCVAEISGGDAALAEVLVRFVSVYEWNARRDDSIFTATDEERSALMSGQLRDIRVIRSVIVRPAPLGERA